MDILESFEFSSLAGLQSKVQELIKENIEKVKKSKLAYKTTKNGDILVLDVLILE